MLPDPKEDPPPVKDSTLGILVSLYLLLLAFFAVLNSVSNQQVSKAGAVMESVSSAFDSFHSEKTKVIDLMGDIKVGLPERSLITRLRGIFDSAISLEGLFASRGGTTIRMVLPASDFFFDGDTEIRDDVSPRLAALGQLLVEAPIGEKREMEIAIGTGDAFPPGADGSLLALRRADSMARKMAEIGVPRSAFAVGFALLEEEFVTIHIRVTNAEKSVLTFADEAGR